MKFVKDVLSKFKKDKLESRVGAPDEEKKNKETRFQKVKKKIADAIPSGAEIKEKISDVIPSGAEIKDTAKKIVTANTGNKAVDNTLKVTGGVLAAGGVVADVALLGGVCTITVLSCLYSDYRNRHEMKKLGKELDKIDDKLDTIGDQTPSKLGTLASTVVPFADVAKKGITKEACAPVTIDMAMPVKKFNA